MLVIFLVFDFDRSESISLQEILIIFVCVINGFARITNQSPPSYYTIEYFAKIMFLKSDISSDNQLDVKEIIDWIYTNSVILGFFEKYEPEQKVKQNL